MAESRAPEFLRQQHTSLSTLVTAAGVSVLSVTAVEAYMASVEKQQQSSVVLLFRKLFGEDGDAFRVAIAGLLGTVGMIAGAEIMAATSYLALGLVTLLAGIGVLAALLRQGRWFTSDLSPDGTYTDRASFPLVEGRVPEFVLERLRKLSPLSPELTFKIRTFGTDPVVSVRLRGELVYIAVYEGGREAHLPLGS